MLLRIRIFLGLKLKEIGGFLAGLWPLWAFLAGSFILGLWVFWVPELVDESAPFSIFAGQVILAFCLGMLEVLALIGLWLLLSRIIWPWIKNNWEEAGILAEKREAKKKDKDT